MQTIESDNGASTLLTEAATTGEYLVDEPVVGCQGLRPQAGKYVTVKIWVPCVALRMTGTGLIAL